jgi:hypothetical protein
MNSNAKQIFIFVYTTISFLLLILVALGFLAGTLIITNIQDDVKRNIFFDRYFGTLKILFAMHDFMFSTIVLGVFYMLGKNHQRESIMGNARKKIDASSFVTKDINDLLNQKTSKNVAEENRYTSKQVLSDNEEPLKSTFKNLQTSMLGSSDTYKLNHQQETDDSIHLAEDERDSTMLDRPTFKQYWIQQMFVKGFRSEDGGSIGGPKFGAFA